MPSNQSSPWGGGKLQVELNVDSSTPAAPQSAHAKTVAAPQVPLSQTSVELSRRKDHAKSLSSPVALSASPLRQRPVPVWGNGDGRKASTQSQLTAVPDQTSDLPPKLKGIQIPNQVQGVGLKQPGRSLSEPVSPYSCPLKECQTGFELQLNGTKPKCDWLQTSQPVNGSGMSRSPPSGARRDAQSEFLHSGYHQDLLIKGKPPLSQTLMVSRFNTHVDSSHWLCVECNISVLTWVQIRVKVMILSLVLYLTLLFLSPQPDAADCSSPPSVPPSCLTLSEHQGAALREDASNLGRTTVQIRSTRRIYSAKVTTKCCQRPHSGTKMSNSLLVVRGGPPPRTSTTLDFIRRVAEGRPRSSQSTCKARRNSSPAVSLCPNGFMPTVLSASISASQEKQPSSLQQPTLMDQSSGN